MLLIKISDVDALVTKRVDAWVQGHTADQLQVEIRTQFLRPSRGRTENGALRLAAGTHKAPHVLEHAQDGDTGFFTEVHLFPYIAQRNFLYQIETCGVVTMIAPSLSAFS